MHMFTVLAIKYWNSSKLRIYYTQALQLLTPHGDTIWSTAHLSAIKISILDEMS